MANQLSFGLNPPAGVDTAWGAGWIIDPQGWVDQVWDRTDAIGPDDRRRELLHYLDARVGYAPHQRPASCSSAASCPGRRTPP
jgi:hypothetical protein